MKQPKDPAKLRVSYMQYKDHGPGWYWWLAQKAPSYHGPFPDEATARRDLARVGKKAFQKEARR